MLSLCNGLSGRQCNPVGKSKLSIEFSVTDGFGDVFALDSIAVFEISNRAGDLADFVVGAGRQVELDNGLLEHHLGLFIQSAVVFDLLVGHDRIAGGADAKSLPLSVASSLDLRSQLFGTATVGGAAEFAELHRRNLDMDIHPVH
jgi:hypothetical protein